MKPLRSGSVRPPVTCPRLPIVYRAPSPSASHFSRWIRTRHALLGAAPTPLDLQHRLASYRWWTFTSGETRMLVRTNTSLGHRHRQAMTDSRPATLAAARPHAAQAPPRAHAPSEPGAKVDVRRAVEDRRTDAVLPLTETPAQRFRWRRCSSAGLLTRGAPVGARSATPLHGPSTGDTLTGIVSRTLAARWTSHTVGHLGSRPPPGERPQTNGGATVSRGPAGQPPASARSLRGPGFILRQAAGRISKVSGEATLGARVVGGYDRADAGRAGAAMTGAGRGGDLGRNADLARRVLESAHVFRIARAEHPIPAPEPVVPGRLATAHFSEFPLPGSRAWRSLDSRLRRPVPTPPNQETSPARTVHAIANPPKQPGPRARTSTPRSIPLELLGTSDGPSSSPSPSSRSGTPVAAHRAAQGPAPGPSARGPAPPQLKSIADQVYSLLVSRLKQERLARGLR